MNTNPEISIIIPAYNTEPYIGKAILSALNQTFANNELIIVDDCSTDRTLEVAKSFDDCRIKILQNEENIGSAATRNKALKIANGNWIALLDSDDWYEPDRLEILLDVAKINQADLVGDDVYFIDDNAKAPWGTLVQQSGQSITQTRVIDLLSYIQDQKFESKSLFVTVTKPLINRQFLVKHGLQYEPEIRLGQDYWFYLDCLIKGAKFVFYPYPYYFQRMRHGSLIKQKASERLEYYCLANRKFLEKKEVQSNQELKFALSKNLSHLKRFLSYYKIVDSMKNRKIPTAVKVIIENPFSLFLLLQRFPRILQSRFLKFVD